MSRPIKGGSTDQSTTIRILDSTTGLPETGVTSATSGLTLNYIREGGSVVNISLSDLAAVNSAHSDGGLKHKGSGYYRLDLPDAAVAGSNTGVIIEGTATDMVIVGAYHPLVAYDPQDTVRLGLTALPNAAADAAGGLPISDAGGLDLDAKIGALTFTVANQVDANAIAISGDTVAADNAEAMFDGTGYAGGTIKLGVDAVAFSGDTTAADNAELFFDGTGYNASNSAIGTVATATTIGTTGLAAIWNRLTSALTTSGSIGKLIVDKLGLITSTTAITASIVSDGDQITIYQGETRTTADGNAITLSVASTIVDLTGYTPKFGITKITANSGTASLEVSGTVTDAGTANQAVVFELTSAQTAALALDTTVTNPFQQNPANSLAYRWTISATDGGSNCPTLASGYASVKARDTTC